MPSKALLIVITFVFVLVACNTKPQAEYYYFGSKKIFSSGKAVKSNTTYSNETGYGFDFENKDKVQVRSGINSFANADVPFYFSVKKPEGNYEVELTFGNPSLASSTNIKAEARRLLLNNYSLNAGESTSKKFVVNVRSPKIDNNREIKLKAREENYMNWDNRLTLEFSGANVAIQEICIRPIDSIRTLFMAGNSTVTDQDCAPWASWGQMITAYLDQQIVVANYAESGEALNTFKARGRLDKIESLLKPGDYLFIEFGHNDQKQQGEGIGPWLSFSNLLIEYIERARNKGAIPVLITPTQRRSFNSEGIIEYTHNDYPAAMRKVANSYKVPLIDLNEMTKKLYESWGPETSKKAFVHFDAKTFPGQNKALADNTHFSPFGAHEVALCVLKGICDSMLELEKHIVGFDKNYTPQKPNMPQKWNVPMSPRFESTKPDGN
ncbi:MAG: rhamnogalacturonan acetylesterase [Prolixibacteraceae bacterium]|nr:rhamnogalacturonan acetylesterase [Prolixibacteraceae bacterium]